ncbi:hypothetical protein M011DRAFT_422345 [Sporormia fimetaria CBS 119925]|uniref:Complex 1 LYR protein domain-containing protein n=1 Tax=Sporormia fimetaria CBS 119925 TaxID=1340428 RepID=A0A6A6VC28_9PLEO|nr:hypothetical protein M011DRAFT_422345 [Sporormia fimetaria CBS 119925]
MPRFILPKRSTQHRVAAIALYRALLSRCTFAPLQDEHRSSLRNAIRQKFRRNRKIASSHQLGLAFRAGYEVLDHLDAASAGDSFSTDFITTELSELGSGLKRPPIRKPPPPPPPPGKHELACLPPEQAVLRVRPYEKVNGPRHVPILSTANRIPFLRLRKPQPASLSRVLRQKLDRRIEIFERRILLGNYWLPLTVQEDRWDQILREELGIPEGTEGTREGKWSDAVRKAYADNTKQYETEVTRDKAIADKMLEIVDKETELALKEGQKIVRGRRVRAKPKPLSKSM